MTHILTFAFTHQKKPNISANLVIKLNGVDTFIIDCTTNELGIDNTQDLLNKIKKTYYSYILGVGIYTSKKSKVKFEKTAKNKFRNDLIVKKAPDSYDISEFLSVPGNIGNIIESHKMGNSWCNMTSYKIKHTLVEYEIPTENGFVHIPNLEDSLDEYTKIIQNIVNHLNHKFP